MFACRLLVILNFLFLVSEAVVDIYLSKDEVEKILGKILFFHSDFINRHYNIYPVHRCQSQGILRPGWCS